MASSRPDLEALLQDGNIIRIRPQGYSMYPLFIPGRDEALIESVSADTVRKNDVVLYRRDQSILVLHRICKITAEGFFMVGDNQSEIEGPLRADQIKGRLIAFVRNGKEISVKNPLYRFLSALWLFMLPLRPVCFRITAFLRGSKKQILFTAEFLSAVMFLPLPLHLPILLTLAHRILLQPVLPAPLYCLLCQH